MKALFICDEKEQWSFFSRLFHTHFKTMELICVLRAQQALETLSYEGPFALIIIECQLRDKDPTQLAEDIFEQGGPKPLLFVGAKELIKEKISKEFIEKYDMVSTSEKPYQENKIISLISTAIKWVKEEDYENSIVQLDPQRFVPIKLRNFYLYKSVPFDVYAEMTKTKFIKAISAHKSYTHSTIQNFQKRNIRFLFLEKNEHLNFLENSIKKMIITLSHKNLDSSKKVQTMIASALVIHQYIRDVGVSDSVKELIERIIQLIPEILKNSSSLYQLLLTFPFKQYDLAEQAILKALINEFIAQKIGWKSGISRSKLVLASLIHDTYLDKEEWATITYRDHPDLDDLTDEKRESFFQHPLKAAEVALQFNHYPESDFIIQQHHERPDGNGFPNGININKITKISATFILVNNFVIQLIINGVTKSSLINILKGFSTIYNVGNFKGPFNILFHEIKKF